MAHPIVMDMAPIFGAQLVGLAVLGAQMTKKVKAAKTFFVICAPTSEAGSNCGSSTGGKRLGEQEQEQQLTNTTPTKSQSAARLLPIPDDAKIRCENWFLLYAVLCWIPVFAAVVFFRIYESMGKWGYMGVCGGLAAPLLLQPVFYPELTGEGRVPFAERHCTKATAWLALYSFLGNYWATHYFYCVLRARYTMDWLPAHQLNGVPICMYFATHFYFSFYHALSNKLLRFFLEKYRDDSWRSAFLALFTLSFAYFTAFLETFSISAFPHYTFENRHQVYTVGSLFYALYLVVSFPMYMRIDEIAGGAGCAPGRRHTLFEACLESLATFMIIMSLLDAVRLWLGIPFAMPAA